MTTNKISIIIPTYNEEENIGLVINELTQILDKKGVIFDILVMDDNSQDNTISLVKKKSHLDSRIKLTIRTSDPGLSQSVVDGFSISNSNYLIVMDADLSHPPEKVCDIYSHLCQGYDIVIGSRYTKNGEIRNWPLKRHILSKGATYLARILFPKVQDPVSGFFGVRRDVVSCAKLKPKGYKILFEILGKGHYKSVIEIPIIFVEREKGSSKLKPSTITDYLEQFFDIFRFKFFYRE